MENDERARAEEAVALLLLNNTDSTKLARIHERVRGRRIEARTIVDFVHESKLGWNRKKEETTEEARTIVDFVHESKLGWGEEWISN